MAFFDHVPKLSDTQSGVGNDIKNVPNPVVHLSHITRRSMLPSPVLFLRGLHVNSRCLHECDVYILTCPTATVLTSLTSCAICDVHSRDGFCQGCLAHNRTPGVIPFRLPNHGLTAVVGEVLFHEGHKMQHTLTKIALHCQKAFEVALIAALAQSSDETAERAEDIIAELKIILQDTVE